MSSEILLTGASSYVGARLFQDISPVHETVGTYNSEQLSPSFQRLDVTDPDQVAAIILEHQPKVIIHAAANASAGWCDANPEAADLLNRQATGFIADMADKTGAKLVLVSSFAAHNPNGVYAQTKADSEEIARNTKDYVILQPSLILGMSPNQTNDRPHNRFLRDIEGKKEPIYDTSWRFQPTYLRHIGEVVLDVIARDITGETIPIAVPGLKSRFDVAQSILPAFGIEPIPEDKHDTQLVEEVALTKLRELGLREYEYEEMMRLIIEEIRNREQYSFK